ncbi:MAG: hypothetical protein HGA85_02675 [Nanoarchaeota archaeon]|nr:hypothetical protein [Nanoarchaeota archaeon]
MDLTKIFKLESKDRVLILYDAADDMGSTWIWRIGFADLLRTDLSKICFTRLGTYRATGANNADLPLTIFLDGQPAAIEDVMKDSTVVIALTEYSATAPLKAFGKKYGIRAASMPGFSEKMLAALEVDYDLLGKKVSEKYERLKKSKSVDIVFQALQKEYFMHFDLRNRVPKKDDGVCTEKGCVINLPSGEAFIVPNEEDSKTEGYLPIEREGKVNIFKVEQNKIVSSLFPDELMDKIKEDPAVGNIAELAFGVLSDFGIKPCGRTLLDEKLGLHIALGRSEHLGGTTSPSSFRKKENVWHQDYVYIKEMQPSIIIKKINFLG